MIKWVGFVEIAVDEWRRAVPSIVMTKTNSIRLDCFKYSATHHKELNAEVGLLLGCCVGSKVAL